MRVSLDKRPEEQVIELLHQPGGYEALGHLIGINPEKLTSAGRIDYLAALERQHSWLTSLIQNATLAIAGSEPSQSENLWEGVDEAEREDVATALRLSANTAQSRIDTARVLTNHLPATCQALAVGDISPSHATLIARETSEAIKRGISTEDLIHIENRALAHAEFHTPAQVGRKIRTLIAQISPETFEESVAIARDTRSVHMYPESDGMATVIALLPAEDAQTDRRPVTINITMDLPTALGMADNPAELAGYGPIPASVARTLSADAKWRRFITDPLTGNLLDYGRETYVPPQPLVDFLTARDRICRFPGCSQPSRISDIDHAIPWEEGGPTSPTNLGLLCRRHHRMKTHNGWKLMSHEDGSCTWTSPAGKEIFVPSRPIHESA